MYNWSEIKGQYLWINVTLEGQGEINNSRHLFIPFMKLALNDLLNFSINSIVDKNRGIEFASNKKIISILNFIIYIFLRWTKDHWNLPIKLKKNKLLFY